MLRIDGNTVHADTRTLTATFTHGLLTSLRSKATGEELICGVDPARSALQLVYANQPAVDVIGNLAASVSVHRLSDHAAQFRLSGWEADGVVTVSEDEATGDLLVEPSAYSSRPGVMACRWLLPGVRDDLELAAPFFQGTKLPLTDSLLQRRWGWPISWEAGLAILQGAQGGFWVHCRDTQYRYKALNIADGQMGFETDAYGPLDRALGAGGLTWRINVHRGDWTVPAAEYRSWLRGAYGLDAVQATRKPWCADLRFALSWYNGDPSILDALAARIEPRKVLIHFSNWRTDPYDENYPTFEPSDRAHETIGKAVAMGFHIMPHCNAVDMDPTHPAYHSLRDFQYRDVASRRLHGWAWDPDGGGVLGVPNSARNLQGNRRRKVMIKVHPGLAMWRSILSENILQAVEAVGTDTVFIDVTLCSHNLDNCLVENTTSSEGMNRLIQQVSELGGGLAVGGEGLNEITMQHLSFAQAHLFLSWHASVDGLERTGGCPLNAFLFDGLCRTFGYSRLGGKSDDEVLRMRRHVELGGLPTVTVGKPEEILEPNAGVREMLDAASS